jgi:uncharacterized protein (TIGR00369 family)
MATVWPCSAVGEAATMGGDVAAEERPEYVDVGATNILTLLRMRRVDDPEAGFALEMELRDEVVNPFRSLHGGLMATLIECSGAGRAVSEGGSERILPSDMHIRFLTTVKVGPARAITKVLRRGRRAIVVQCDVIDVGNDRKLVASATLSYTLLDSSTADAPAG